MSPPGSSKRFVASSPRQAYREQFLGHPGVVSHALLDADQLPRSRSSSQGASDTGRRLGTTLLNAFTVLAILLASLGIYGVMAYGVARRSREVAVRCALGARRADVVRMVVMESMTMAGVGIALGLAGGVALGRAVSTLLFAVSPADPMTLVGAPVLLVTVALAASLIPARRAARTEPMEALRGN